jgi:hypothetical protein
MARADDPAAEGDPLSWQSGSVAVDESALGKVRGMGAALLDHGALAVILWDEKTKCCVRPRIGQEGQGESAAAAQAVSWRVVVNH